MIYKFGIGYTIILQLFIICPKKIAQSGGAGNFMYAFSTRILFFIYCTI